MQMSRSAQSDLRLARLDQLRKPPFACGGLLGAVHPMNDDLAIAGRRGFEIGPCALVALELLHCLWRQHQFAGLLEGIDGGLFGLAFLECIKARQRHASFGDECLNLGDVDRAPNGAGATWRVSRATFETGLPWQRTWDRSLGSMADLAKCWTSGCRDFRCHYFPLRLCSSPAPAFCRHVYIQSSTIRKCDARDPQHPTAWRRCCSMIGHIHSIAIAARLLPSHPSKLAHPPHKAMRSTARPSPAEPCTPCCVPDKSPYSPTSRKIARRPENRDHS